jgi:uncharacterized membrane protein YccC
MFSLSGRARQAIKTALAMTIVYGISLRMGWENPYWAGFAVAMISLTTVGQSLNKGAMRMLGTLVAAIVSLTLIAWFAQERWWFITVLSLYVGFCTYMITGKKITYFWWCSVFVCLVIATHATGDFPNAFNIAVLRVQQTGTGILVYTLVSVFLWPSSNRGALDEATQKLFTAQLKLYRAYRGLLNGRGTIESSRPLRMQEVQLLSEREQALHAAQTDSHEVREMRHQWWHFHRQSTSLMETLEHWRESFPEIQSLDQGKLLPNLGEVCTELDLRFEEIQRMLAGEAPARLPQSATLTVDETAMNALTHFQKAAVAVTRTEIDHLEALSRTLFDSVQDLKGYGPQPSSPLPKDTRAGGGPGFDPDRLHAAVKAMAVLWATFLIWFYVNPPGHTSFVELATIFVMVSAMLRVDPATIVKPFLIGAFLAGLLYVFVMPHLSGYAQLGTMIFVVTFAIYYLLWQPRQALAKTGILVQFLSVIGVQNQQTYDFAAYANSTLSLALAGAITIGIWYLPPSPRPEKAFLRLLARFFRHSEYLLSRLALDGDRKKGIGRRWKKTFYQADSLELPQKLALWGGKIDHQLFPDNSPELVQALVISLDAFALRLEALAGMRDLPQADLLVRELLEDVRAWRLIAEQHLRLWAQNPALALGQSAEMQDRLTARLARLETRVEETFRLVGEGEGELSAEDYENFYRLLGSYRSLSEAGIDYARLAEKINWDQWREARF